MSQLLEQCHRKLWEAKHSGSSALIVHHWDTDGIASAALAARILESPYRPVTPRIGEYSVEAIPLDSYMQTILVLDYGLPGPEYEKLARRIGDRVLIVVDHHRVPPSPREWYCNPVARGIGVEADYPANAYLLYRIWRRTSGERGEALLAALGIVGDLSAYIEAGQQHPGVEKAQQLLEGAGERVELQGLLEAARALDSCYKLGDQKCIENAVRIAAENPYSILHYQPAIENMERAERIIEEILARLEENAVITPTYNFYILRDNRPVTGVLARRLAAANPEKIIVLAHHLPQARRMKIYIRSIKRIGELNRLRRKLVGKGYDVRGKESVIVLEEASEKSCKTLQQLLELINTNSSLPETVCSQARTNTNTLAANKTREKKQNT